MTSIKKYLLGGGGVLAVILGAHLLGGGANAIKAGSSMSNASRFQQCQARLGGAPVGDDKICREYFDDLASRLKDTPELTAVDGVPMETIRSAHADLNRDKARQGLPLYAELPEAPNN